MQTTDNAIGPTGCVGPSTAASGRFARRALAVLALSFVSGIALADQETEASRAAADEDRVLEEVIVTAQGSQVELTPEYAGGQVARGGRMGILGNMDMMDTPFTSMNYTAELMLDQQADGVGDVLLNDPVVRVARGFGNFQEVFVIRGFPAFSDDMTYNGIYGILPRQFVASEFLERVELFRGANSFINGAAPGGSNIGGAVNLVPKRAGEEPLTRFTLGWEESSHLYGALDFGRRFGTDGNHGLRVNLAGRDGETSVDDQDRELTVFGLGYDYSGERLRLSADLGYQDNHIDAPRPSVTPIGGIAAAPDSTTNFAQPWTFTDEEQTFGVVRGEYDFTDMVTGWLAFGLRDGEEHNVLANPNALPDGSTTAYRFDNIRKDEVYSGDAGVRFDFDTGSVGHRVIASVSDFSVESKNAYAFSSFFDPFPGDLYNPFPVPPPPANFFTGGTFDDPHVTFTTDTTSFALADIMAFMDERVLLTVGARNQNIESESFDYNTGASFGGYDESGWTPVGGLVVRWGETVSVYANYAEALLPGEVAPAVSGGMPVENAGQVFDPYESEQYEVGVKYDGGEFGGSLAAFELSQPTSVVQDNVFSPSGETRNRGIELSMFGQPHERVRLLGGLTWLESEVTRSQDGLYDGMDAVGKPDTQLNVNGEWDIPGLENLTVDGRVIYTASQWADSANTLEVSSWTRFDLGARYRAEIAGRPVVFRARLDNVTDEDDWVSVGGYPGANYMVLGNPRTFSVNASIDF
jgi:iron complex outermembrane receptor protein